MKKFITFEGLDGCGKTTQALLLKEHFEKLGEIVLSIREPGTTPLGEVLRDAVLKKNIEINPAAEALLFASARAQLNDILKENYSKKIIICDRYLDSSIAYQSFGRGLDLEFVKKINEFAYIKPDVTFFIDIEPKACIKRFSTIDKISEIDRIEKENINFYNSVYEGYKQLAKEEKRIITIDGSKTIDCIHLEILSYL